MKEVLKSPEMTKQVRRFIHAIDKYLQTITCKTGLNKSEIDYRQQLGVHVSQQIFISGPDQPVDLPEHRLGLL